MDIFDLDMQKSVDCIPKRSGVTKKTKKDDNEEKKSQRDALETKSVKSKKSKKAKKPKKTKENNINDSVVESEDIKSQVSKNFTALSSLYKRQSTFRQGDQDEIVQLKIEFERLQTTIGILNGKLRTQKETENQLNELRKRVKQVETEKATME